MGSAFRRIHVTGASGAGVTSLGRALAARLPARHFDVDEYYWMPTDPPYRLKREIAERVALLSQDLGTLSSWVISGSLIDWGDGLIADADLILYLDTPTEIRIERLQRRQAEHFGDRILPGGLMYEQHQAFLEWAAGYDSGAFGGRSRPRHEGWLAGRPQQVMRLDGQMSIDDLVWTVLAA